MPSQDFEELSKSIMDEILGWDPSVATQLGWHKYDHEVMDPRREAYERQCERFSDFVRVMEDFDTDSLSEDQKIDRDLAIYLFRLRIFEISILRIHEQMSIAEDEIGRSLFFLFARDYLPFETRIEAITSRLEKTPEFLEKAKTTLVNPCRAWNEVSLESGKRLINFLETIRETGAAILEDADQIIRLGRSIEVATEAIKSYEDWLSNDILPKSHETSAVSVQDFDDYMRIKEFGISPDDALEIAELGLAAANRHRGKLAKTIAQSGLLKDALRMMKEDHPPSFEGVMKAYREWIEKARDFVTEKQLATIPEGEKLLVLETPNFMRHLAPFAAQYEPGKYSNDKKGLFLVTPDEGNPERLKEHCSATTANTAVHEGYPGHHLQGICSNSNPSHIRTLSSAACFGEGWALYCERLMISEGFQNNPMGKLAQLNDLVFRIVRVTADVNMARGTMTPDDVADMLVAQTGMDRQGALDDAKSSTYIMTSYLSYFIGMLQIIQLKEDVEKALGDRFDLREFHDSLLNAGCLPMHFMRRVERVRLKRDYGVDLMGPSESLLDFTKRLTSTPEPF
ncbi:MAG: DUF885 domain-containing protein [Thermoplasmata archaeon]